MGLFSGNKSFFGIGGAVGNVLGKATPAGWAYNAVKGPMDEAEARRAGFDPYSGMPVGADFIGMDDSILKNAGPASMQISNEAMRQGPSRGAELAGMEQRRQLGVNRDQLKKQSMGEAAQAKNALAMKGGLSSGAAERINTGMGSAAMEMGQGARQGYAKNMASIGMEDEGNRQKMLQGAAGIEAQGLGRVQGQNIAKNAYNAKKYGDQMSAWAGGKQAQATQNAGKKA